METSPLICEASMISASVLKGLKVLMQIWKSSYMFVFILKQYSENIAFFILIILELFAHEVCKFLKK